MEKSYINITGASYSLAHVLSFESEKAFVAAHIADLKFMDEKSAKAALRSAYKEAVLKSTDKKV